LQCEKRPNKTMWPLSVDDEMLKTLLVEDSTLFRRTFKEALNRRFPSLAIGEAIDGKEALEKVETLGPHLVFMDIRLPGESGLELTRKIKASHPEIVVIILTHYDLLEYREAARDVGADGYIAKDSLDLSEIAALIESMISTREG
jgi:DNA-binding NarL/FixJ family response regulator